MSFLNPALIKNIFGRIGFAQCNFALFEFSLNEDDPKVILTL